MEHQNSRQTPFELSPSFSDPIRRALFALVKYPLEKLLGLRELARLYRREVGDDIPDDLVELALNTLEIRHDLSSNQLNHIPKEGPLVVVANHPYGGMEGLVLISSLRKVRPDVKVLANYVLQRLPGLDRWMIYADPFGTDRSIRFNVAAARQTIDWLNRGGVLIVFPAGQVSHLHLKRWVVCDREWQDPVARFIRKARAPVVPFYFEGQNGIAFQLAGLVHPRLRTIMLPRAFLKARGRTIRVQVGEIIPFSRLESYESDSDILDYLRMCTYMLSGDDPRKNARRMTSVRRRQSRFEPIIDPPDPSELERDLANLPAEQLLDTSGEFEVWWAGMDQTPNMVREIGRLREVTYREVGEGTGKSIDLDSYDRYYLHLFVWNKRNRELVGAYRLGQTDRILSQYGKKGLYSSKFFRFTDGFLSHLDPALEMGRSFVRAEYQKQHSPMALLWKGIGVYVAHHPKYKILFGMISISNDYLSVSRQMMIAFLRANAYLPKLAKLLRPRKPPRWRPTDVVQDCGRLVTDINEVSSLISGIEDDQKGVPVLLRQYLRINAKFISCNVVPFFGEIWAGLMLADLTETDPRMLERHLGKEGAARFLEYHRERDRMAAKGVASAAVANRIEMPEHRRVTGIQGK